MQDFLQREIRLFNYTTTLGEVALGLMVLAAGIAAIHWGSRFLATRLAGRRVRADAIHIARRVFVVLAYTALLFTTLEILNIPITAFAFISGAIAVGIGFGAQNIINNFISGWILMWERPVRIGDFLEIGSDRGTVESINTRSTRIRRPDGVHMLIPNSALLENTVVNWTLVDDVVRTSVRVGVAYGSPVEQVSKLLRQAVDEQSEVLRTPAPVVVFEDFGDSALIFDAFFWLHASGERELRVTRGDIRLRIDRLFAEHDIVIAFPQRDLHIDGLLRLERSRPVREVEHEQP